MSGTGSAESSNSSDSSVGGESTGTSGSSNNGSTQSSVEESGLLGGNNGRTSYLVSTQFGRIIQALGGNSAGGINRAAARGFVNYNGSKPPSLHSDIPVNSGGSNIPSSAGTNGSSPDTSGIIIGGVISGSEIRSLAAEEVAQMVDHRGLARQALLEGRLEIQEMFLAEVMHNLEIMQLTTTCVLWVLTAVNV